MELPFELFETLLMQVCAYWHDVVSDGAYFWQEYILSPHRKTADVQRWAANFRHHPLDLRVYLDSNNPAFNVVVPPHRLDLRSTTILGGAFAPMCRRLHVCANEVFGLPLFLDHVRTADGARLDSCSITRLLAPNPTNVSSFCTLTSPIFTGGLLCLRYVRLMAFVLSWIDLRYYTHAVCIVFHQVLKAGLIPTWIQLANVLICALDLERLSLRHFSCGPPDGLPPRMLLRNLVELDLCFCGDTLSTFIGNCDLPSLTALSVLFTTSDDIDILLSYRDILSGLTSFCPTGVCDRTSDIIAMYRLMPKLLQLNLSDASSLFFNALVGGSVLPVLLRLSVGDFPLNHVRSILRSRIKQSMLDLLCVHGLYSLVDGAADARWLKRHVAAFYVEPDYNFGDDWMYHHV
ncbi:hypothetical protein C8R44DRAFT_896141 [Mycena epipterygia]|nr:hypothetical protein C8R44DRAFT_896141 [Mycena epipterygia]